MTGWTSRVARTLRALPQAQTDLRALRIKLLNFLGAGFAGLVLITGAQAGTPAERVVRLTSFQWPPYTGQNLEQQGSTTDTLRRAFAAMGYSLQIEFHSARRAVALAGASNSSQLGYFPELFSPELERRWVLSEAVGVSPLGLAQRSSNQVAWTIPENLKAYTLGQVEDELIPGHLGRLINDGLQRTETVPDDASNLLQLASGRVDLAIIDSLAFASLMGNDPRLVPIRGQLVMNPRLLESRSLHVAFRRTREGQRMAEILAQGLQRIGFIPPSVPSH